MGMISLVDIVHTASVSGLEDLYNIRYGKDICIVGVRVFSRLRSLYGTSA